MEERTESQKQDSSNIESLMDSASVQAQSSSDNTDSIVGLVESIRLQSVNIDKLVDGLKTMSFQLQERPTRKGVLRITGAIGALAVATILTLNFLAYSDSHDALNEIKSCATPEGECSVRGEENRRVAVAHIICNQEKVLYFQNYELGYIPQPHCIEFTNLEIDRLEGGSIKAPPKLPVPEGVRQYGIGVG